MNHQWHDTMVDRPEADGPAYVTGWTISGLAVIATILAVWLLGNLAKRQARVSRSLRTRSASTPRRAER